MTDMNENLAKVRAMLEEVARPIVEQATEAIADALVRGDTGVAAQIHYDANQQLRATFRPLEDLYNMAPAKPFIVNGDALGVSVGVTSESNSGKDEENGG